MESNSALDQLSTGHVAMDGFVTQPCLPAVELMTVTLGPISILLGVPCSSFENTNMTATLMRMMSKRVVSMFSSLLKLGTRRIKRRKSVAVIDHVGGNAVIVHLRSSTSKWRTSNERSSRVGAATFCHWILEYQRRL